jgi:hypothetical protein
MPDTEEPQMTQMNADIKDRSEPICVICGQIPA